MLPEEEQAKEYDKTGNEPLAWELSADDLEASAAILKEARDGFDPNSLKLGDEIPDEDKVLFPELMLRALSLECLLKALWLKQGNKIAEDGEYKGVKGAGDHDLLQLAAVVGLKLDKTEKDVLKRLSKIMTSNGRYPIPKNWKAGRIQEWHGGNIGPPGFWRHPSDDQVLSRVVNDVKTELDQ